MVRIFSSTTAFLATDFVEKFSLDRLEYELFVLSVETGVSINRTKQTFTITGSWDSMQGAYTFLEELEEKRFQNAQSGEKPPDGLLNATVKNTKKDGTYESLPSPDFVYGYGKRPDGDSSQKDGDTNEKETEKAKGTYPEKEGCVTLKEERKDTDVENDLDDGEDNLEDDLDDGVAEIRPRIVRRLQPLSKSKISLKYRKKRRPPIRRERDRSYVPKVRRETVHEEEEMEESKNEETSADGSGNQEEGTSTGGFRGGRRRSLRKPAPRVATQISLPEPSRRKRKLKEPVKFVATDDSTEEELEKKIEDDDEATLDDEGNPLHLSSSIMKKKRGKGKKKRVVDPNMTYPCPECEYVGKTPKHLFEHRRRQHAIFSQCKVCGKTFGFNKDLNRHIKNVHCDPEYCCTVCNRYYKNRKVYERHLETHSDGYIRPCFKCQMCEKSFSTKYVLSTHIKAEHLGIRKTYLCPKCGKSFKQKISYIQHANMHAGIRPFVCDVCGKDFIYEKSLREHKYIHTDVRKFICDICAKTFKKKTSLRIHMKVHSDAKDHICSSCGRGFTQKQALVRHERIHTGAKPYHCTVCQKTFGDNSTIRRHIILTHKSDPKKWREFVHAELGRSRNNQNIHHHQSSAAAVPPSQPPPQPQPQLQPQPQQQQPLQNPTSENDHRAMQRPMSQPLFPGMPGTQPMVPKRPPKPKPPVVRKEMGHPTITDDPNKDMPKDLLLAATNQRQPYPAHQRPFPAHTGNMQQHLQPMCTNDAIYTHQGSESNQEMPQAAPAAAAATSAEFAGFSPLQLPMSPFFGQRDGRYPDLNRAWEYPPYSASGYFMPGQRPPYPPYTGQQN
ncbi:hypothetical protein CHS0354_037142 [Potamilus streckersoni]|uniref:C2H2-type domain-containing protein n=1 Tax=Potamilus streckersoni TaxID=2493646 RepID=A0AAE0VGI7_9BIVA|nr:hypothetical protein CHS0354_037142 [Potamilus streckersoni]